MKNEVINEIRRNGVSGYPVLIILPVLLSIAGWSFYSAVSVENILWLLVSAFFFITILLLGVTGFFLVNQNQDRV